MRALGLDVGTKRIGVALSDELGLTAQALTVLERRGSRVDAEALRDLASLHTVERFVVGLPLNMNGSEGPRAIDARAFSASLEKTTGLPVELWDERLTTVAAQRVLLEADLSRAHRRRVVDQVAAALILQGWLDARATPRADEEE